MELHEVLLLALAIGSAVLCFLVLLGRVGGKGGEEEETISEIMRGGG